MPTNIVTRINGEEINLLVIKNKSKQEENIVQAKVLDNSFCFALCSAITMKGWISVVQTDL